MGNLGETSQVSVYFLGRDDAINESFIGQMTFCLLAGILANGERKNEKNHSYKCEHKSNIF